MIGHAVGEVVTNNRCGDVGKWAPLTIGELRLAGSTYDELRAFLGLDPSENLEADMLVIPTNLVSG